MQLKSYRADSSVSPCQNSKHGFACAGAAQRRPLSGWGGKDAPEGFSSCYKCCRLLSRLDWHCTVVYHVYPRSKVMGSGVKTWLNSLCGCCVEAVASGREASAGVPWVVRIIISPFFSEPPDPEHPRGRLGGGGDRVVFMSSLIAFVARRGGRVLST